MPVEISHNFEELWHLQFTHKPMRHWILKIRNSSREMIVITIVIVVRATQKRQKSAFSIVLAIIFQPQFLLFKIWCPCGLCVNWKDWLKFIYPFCLLSWHKFAWCEICWRIQKRFYQRLITRLEMALASLSWFVILSIEEAITRPNLEIL